MGNYFWSAVRGMTPSLWRKVEQEGVKKSVFPKGGFMNIKEYIKEEGRQEGLPQGYAIGYAIGYATEIMRQKSIQKIMEEGMQKGIQKGRTEGMQADMQQGQRKLILKLLDGGLDIQSICKYTGLSEEEIKKLKNGSN